MIRIGLYGSNGHQIFHELDNHPFARVDAVAGVPDEILAELCLDASRIHIADSFANLIADDALDMISLCSPRRRDQADQAVEAMRHGKHVLAEKPCALSESDLDRIVQTSAETGRCFHEMAGTAFDFPYHAMRETVLAGTIGDVVQVIAEKSYPYHSRRPAERDIDGGLIGQNMIHALRLVEHVASVPITSLDTLATTTGLPTDAGGPHMAASILAVLKNGAIASLSANYLNPKGTGVWGDDSLRILGTRGMVESLHGGQFTRLVVGDHDHGPLKPDAYAPTWLDMVIRHVASQAEMPLPLEIELSPTRWAIRATEGCKAQLGN